MQWPEILFICSSEALSLRCFALMKQISKMDKRLKRKVWNCLGEGKPLKPKWERFLGKNWFQAKWKRICKLLNLPHGSSCELIAETGDWNLCLPPLGTGGSPLSFRCPHSSVSRAPGWPCSGSGSSSGSAVTGKLLSWGYLFCFAFSWKKRSLCKAVVSFGMPRWGRLILDICGQAVHQRPSSLSGLWCVCLPVSSAGFQGLQRGFAVLLAVARRGTGGCIARCPRKWAALNSAGKGAETKRGIGASCKGRTTCVQKSIVPVDITRALLPASYLWLTAKGVGFLCPIFEWSGWCCGSLVLLQQQHPIKVNTGIPQPNSAFLVSGPLQALEYAWAAICIERLMKVCCL